MPSIGSKYMLPQLQLSPINATQIVEKTATIVTLKNLEARDDCLPHLILVIPPFPLELGPHPV